jgi:outer membrane protein TolC
MRAASAEEKNQSTLVDDTVLKVEDQAVHALVAFIQAKREVDVVRRILQIREDSLRISRERFSRGLMASQEVDKIAVDRGNDESRLRDTEIKALAAEGDLINLLGHANVALDWPWREKIERPAKLLAAEEADLSRRPDWAAAEEKVRATDERANQSWGKILPSLDAGVNYGYFRNDGNARLMTGNPHGSEWSANLTLSIPLFDRLDRYGTYQAASRAKSIAELELERVRRAAGGEWRAARASMGLALQTARIRVETLAT